MHILPILLRVVYLIIIELWFFMYSGYKFFFSYTFRKYFPPVCSLPFSFLNSVLQRAEVFIFQVVLISYGHFSAYLLVFNRFFLLPMVVYFHTWVDQQSAKNVETPLQI